jgi:hypothetical protein
MKKRIRMLTAVQFAKEASISYTTVMSWLKQGLVPGAEKKADHRGEYWDIPDTALKMERPKAGRPSKRQPESTKKKATKK